MFVARNIKTEHKDLIHDVAYDFYGTRMATCSSDQTVRIWECDTETGNWNCTASWKVIDKIHLPNNNVIPTSTNKCIQK